MTDKQRIAELERELIALKAQVSMLAGQIVYRPAYPVPVQIPTPATALGQPSRFSNAVMGETPAHLRTMGNWQ